MTTHEVVNQTPALVDFNLFASDPVLVGALRREGAGWATERVHAFGGRMGSEEMIRAGFQANENPPVLKTHDRYGRRVDEVDFHPAWHLAMRESIGCGLHSLPWAEPRAGAHVARIALMFLASQTEAGHTCPVSMTYAAIPALRKQPELAEHWERAILRNCYDPSVRPACEKDGLLIGMAMTEKQGGSDVRANATRAEAVGGGSGEYRLTGHKWFCSAPMSDAFLVLAQAAGGLTCFLLPRWRADGTRNAFYLQRLKNKLGNRSNASSEVEFAAAEAWRIGEEGRGVPTIIEMVQHTRLDCVMGAAAVMRQALVQAVHHARHRMAFGKRLAEQPLMRKVLADLALESEAATLLMMRLAAAFDGRGAEEHELGLARLGTAVGKYWVAKRCAPMVAECLECLGGNGYVEDSGMPRLYREAPLNSIWEGSGNVICLDVLRAVAKEPAAFEAVRAEIGAAKGGNRHLDALAAELADFPREESQARLLTEKLALGLEASLMVRFAEPGRADAFCAVRLGGGGGRMYGTSSMDGAGDVVEGCFRI